MNRYPWNIWTVYAAATPVVVMLALFFVAVPQFDRALEQRQTLALQQDRVALHRNREAALEDVYLCKQKLEEASTWLDQVSSGKVSSAAVLEVLFELSESTGTELTEIRPAEPPEEGWLGFTLQSRGSYHNVGRLVNGLEQSRFIVSVEKLQVERRQRESRVDALLVFSVYTGEGL